MKETQLEIQVCNLYWHTWILLIFVWPPQPRDNCTWLHGKQVITPGPDVICALPVEDPCQTHQGKRWCSKLSFFYHVWINSDIRVHVEVTLVQGWWHLRELLTVAVPAVSSGLWLELILFLRSFVVGMENPIQHTSALFNIGAGSCRLLGECSISIYCVFAE